MELSLIIPAFNEADRIGATLERVTSFLEGLRLSFEVIVVDDGSRDRTAEAALLRNDPRVRVIRLERNQGKGWAVRTGMLAATGEWRFFSDADLSTPIEEVEPFLERLRQGADLCIGNRALDRARIRVHQPWPRELLGRAFSIVVRLTGLSSFSDTQCGFKGFRAEAAEAVFRKQTIRGFCFDIEILSQARELGLRVDQLAVDWADSGRSSLSLLKDLPSIASELLRLALPPRRRG